MNSAEFETVIKTFVKEKPTVIYKKIQKLYPQQYPKYGANYETTDAAIQEMTAFLIRKGEASGDYIKFLASL